MSNRQFVACKFRPGDRRSYTYHWDGEPLAPGDEVKVPDKSGDGWSRVIVDSVSWAIRLSPPSRSWARPMSPPRPQPMGISRYEHQARARPV